MMYSAEDESRANGSGSANPAFVSDDDTAPNGHLPGKPKVNPFSVQEDQDFNSSKSDHDKIREGCSLFGIVPLPFLSKLFLKAQWLLVFLCWASTIQGMVVNGFVNVVISSLERRFGLTSAQTGLIAGSYDIGSLLSVIPITYFGGRLGSSKPRYISLGMFMMGCGSLVFFLPHFITGQYLPIDVVSESESGDSGAQICNLNGGSGDEETQCVEEFTASLTRYRWFFNLGQFLNGIGAAPLITLGTTLLDESVSKKNSPMYIGIFQTFFVIGPAIGYILGGRLLALYTDFDTLEPGVNVSLTTNSPLWVGAWWLGFLITWLMAWCCSFCFALFPAVLPGAEKHNQVKASDGFGTLKELPKAIKALLTNPTYMFIAFGGAMDGFSVAGLSTFLPKFLQAQYGFTASLASVLVGVMAVPMGGGGTFAGGFITRRRRLTRTGVIKMWMFFQFFCIPLAFGFIVFHCGSLPFAGVNQYYSGTPTALQEEPYSLDSSCNAGCKCSDYEYNPVCGADGVNYFSPCYAGCINGGGGNFTDCSCIDEEIGTQSAVKDHCGNKCGLMYGLFITVSANIFCTFMTSMPNVIATLRAVEPVHRSLALGVESIVFRLAGSIPGPILFGTLIDNTCVLWDKKECDDSVGNCLVYDNWTMAYSILATQMTVKALGVLFFGGAWYFSKRSHIRDDVATE